MNIVLAIILTPIVCIIFAEIIFRMFFEESFVGLMQSGYRQMVLNKAKNHDDSYKPITQIKESENEPQIQIEEPEIKFPSVDDKIKDKIRRIQKKELPEIRIAYRKQCEDKANAILTKNLGRLTKENVLAVIDLLDSDLKYSKYVKRRFGHLFQSNLGRITRHTVYNLDKINHLIIEIYRKEKLDDVNDLISDLRSISHGFVSCLLYLKNRDRYNVLLPSTFNGLREVFPEEFGEIFLEESNLPNNFREFYLLFNRFANELKTKCNLYPQEVDLVLRTLGNPKEMREISY